MNKTNEILLQFLDINNKIKREDIKEITMTISKLYNCSQNELINYVLGRISNDTNEINLDDCLEYLKDFVKLKTINNKIIENINKEEYKGIGDNATICDGQKIVMEKYENKDSINKRNVKHVKNSKKNNIKENRYLKNKKPKREGINNDDFRSNEEFRNNNSIEKNKEHIIKEDIKSNV